MLDRSLQEGLRFLVIARAPQCRALHEFEAIVARCDAERLVTGIDDHAKRLVTRPLARHVEELVELFGRLVHTISVTAAS